ncbi:MAG: replicative DNA helicase [Microscillaceae bacterium]|nr:replicative DNA helicase [Microscillaceae bacterium]
MADSKSNYPKNRGTQNTHLSGQLGKLPPQVLELEEAVLGALMIESEALNQVIDILRPESFYKIAHQEIYRAIFELFSESEPIDMLTVVNQLRKKVKLEMVGGPHYIMRLTSSINSAANIEYHARVITEQAIKRELIAIASEIQRDAFEDSTDVFDLLDSAEQKLFQISESNIRKNFSTMSPLVQQAIKEMEARKDIKDGLTGVPTGFTALDRITAGWQKSDLIILAARPGMGKCLAPETLVLMYDGSLQEAQNIRIGDLLMGPDSKPRLVLSLGSGWEKMYWIRQQNALDYRVNESHILSLQYKKPSNEYSILNISVKDFLEKSDDFKANCLGYKTAIEFTEQVTEIDPYALVTQVAVSPTVDHWAFEENHSCTQTALQVQNKPIPQAYILNSTENRLRLLAALVDTLGEYLIEEQTYQLTFENEALASQVKFLSDTLGLRTSLQSGNKACQLLLQGDLDKIPVQDPAKKAAAWNLPQSWQLTDIEVVYDQVDRYCGFELDGDGLFLLADMTVTHNTAFSLSALRNAAVDFNSPVAFFSLEMSELQLVNRLISAEAELEGNKIKIGKLEEYEWQQLYQKTTKISEAPIFIDDTPALSVLELRAKCRRLKAQHDIQLIIVDYLQLMTVGTGKGMQGNREQEIATISRNLKNIAKELNVPVIALSQLSRAVETRGGDKRPQLSDLRESGCLTGDTLILNAQTGELTPIKELAERTQQENITCLGVDENYKLNPENMVKVFYSGKKQVFELQTRSGRSIKASANHPFLKLSGWMSLDKLQVGDKIAVPRKINIQKPSNPLSEQELILLAHLIGDGCILPKQPYHYTSADPANIEVVNQAAKELFGIEGHIVRQENWWHTYLRSPYRLTHGKKHPITDWYNRLGLDRVRAPEKQLPKALFQCDESRIALFLHHLWATDGNISWKELKNRNKSTAIYYSTSSKILAQQVQHLLIRLGIQNSIKSLESKKGYRTMYSVHVTGVTNQVAFLQKVNSYGERGVLRNEMIQALSKIEANPNYDVIPQEVWKEVIEYYKNIQGISWRTFYNKMEMQYAGFAIFNNGISRERMNRIFHQVLPFQKIKHLAESDLLWDEIVAITPLGIEDVYDATVDKVHNFVANDVVTHNSIEQDADIVLFLYRPEYYGITQDMEGNPTAGVGEVIIAKHRNGSLADVKLKFIGKYTKFGNLEGDEFRSNESNDHKGKTITFSSKANPTGNGNFNNPPAARTDDEPPF